MQIIKINWRGAISKLIMGAGIVILLFAVLDICASIGRLPYIFGMESMSPLIIGGGLTIIGVFLMDFFGWGKVTNEND